MRYLTLSEVLDLHRQIIAQSGGLVGVHDGGALESALAQPRMTLGGEDLSPTVVEKASALGFSLIRNPLWMATNGQAMQRWKHSSS
jgi:death-on-curing protein